ncbi:MAG TPA: energy-coupling factor transporter transmembrane component T [Thermodesulfobacteriota bacterium]|nr:energy-coupling factor transporter transmembrane component T [Thermodesulfobacteriota bacterium]
MNIFLYLERDTWIHRLDPRTKIMGVLIGFMICLCFNHPLYMAAISFSVLLIGLSAKAMPNFWRLRMILLLLVLSGGVLWPFFVEGRTHLWGWGPLKVSTESLLFGIAMGLRLATFVAIGLIFLSTTRNEELTNGLIRMGLPYPIAFAFSTALRLIPTFAGAGVTIVQAQISRGLDLESGNIWSRVGKFIPLAVPLFIYALRHTNLLAMALESKGFSPEAKRTLYYEPRMRRTDYAVLALLTIILMALLYLRLGLHLGVILPGRL